MIITIRKYAKSKDIAAALKKLEHSKDKKNLSVFYGKLKGAFGDAMEYQKKLRGEWG
jgi:hypothetical protein